MVMNDKIYNFYLKHPSLKKLRHDSLLTYPIEFYITVRDLFCYKTMAFVEWLRTLPRQYGYKDADYLPLKQMEGKYKGKRCFITCTGPSLTIEDLEALKDEYVFGMNSICLIHDKTSWKPDFFGVQDDAVYEKIQDTLRTTDNGIVFLPHEYKKKYGAPADWISFPICGSYHLWECYRLKKYFSKFSKDCYVKVYDGFSITITLVQLAFYLGFDEIYLLGADCSYQGEKQHFIETGHVSDYTNTGDRFMATYSQLKEFADKKNLKIYNATRGGYLEVFQRVNFDEVIKYSRKNKKG